MRIERIQMGSAAGIDTSQARYFQQAWKEAQHQIKDLDGLILDPFARNCEWADITNDLNPDTKAKYHLDAKDFLQLMLDEHGTNSVKCLIFDPPFSTRQYEKYEKEGRGRQTLKARYIWGKIIESQIETGTPYFLYKD